MTRFLAGRLLQAVIVLAVMSFAVYGLIGLMPGDPIDAMIAADPELTSEDTERLKAVYGLDRPVWERYLSWAGHALGGDFGHSRIYHRPALDLLAERLPHTVLLMGLAFALSVAIAIPAGIFAALKANRFGDYAVNFICFAGISTPPFWLAIMAMLLFSVTLGWLPATGYPAAGDAGWPERLRHLILPVAVLGLLSAGGITRYVRASMREALRQDYVRTARAKGLSRAAAVRRHVLRNAMIPVVTILALDMGALFSGALITEIMFGYPGMGALIYNAVMANDYNLALIGLLFATLTTLAANIAADGAYIALDPRIAFRAGT